MKKTTMVWMVCAVAALFILTAGVLPAQDKPVTVGDLLKKLGCPLTADQTKKIADIDLAGGREAFMGLNAAFDEKQTAALKKELGTQPGRGGGPETPRLLRQLVVFEKSKCPLTEKQVEAMKKIEPGQGANQAISALYTDAQKAAMAKVFPPRQ